MSIVSGPPVWALLALAAWITTDLNAPPPLAYIDPGTGALILQMLIGAVVGVLVFARNQVRRLAAWFGGLLGRGGGSSETGEERPTGESTRASETEAGGTGTGEDRTSREA